jgi:uncharacterized membrane-anchored protein
MMLNLRQVGFTVGLILAASNLAAQQEDSTEIQWQDAGQTAFLGNVAMLSIPAGCQFTDSKGARMLAERLQNLPNPKTLGVVVCVLEDRGTDEPAYWYAEFAFSADGYVKNAADEKLDPNGILEIVRQATLQGNAELRQRGWPTMEVVGWQREPFYDPTTSNATWSLQGRSSDGSTAINHRVRLLGRRGVLAVNMVASPEDYQGAEAGLTNLIRTTSFVPGERYSEFQEGDRIAEYGLTALIAGGAGAAAAKLGLFGKLWKFIAGFVIAFWKLLAAAAVGAGSWLFSFFKRRSKRVEQDLSRQYQRGPDGPRNI